VRWVDGGVKPKTKKAVFVALSAKHATISRKIKD
jgi:hypothetical protein